MSGSGQAIEEAMANKDLQKYLVDFGTGMAGQRNFADSIGAGLQTAGSGLSKRLSVEAETERRKKMINDVLGGDISKLTTGEMARKGLELLNTGDPNLGAIGQKLIDSSMRKPAEWQQTMVDVGGRQVPAQINTTTGEIKPFSADAINGPKLQYVPELQTFVDPYGNPATPAAMQQPTGVQQPQSMIGGFTNTAIQTPVSQSPIQTMGGVPMTPKAQTDFAIWGAKNQAEQAQKIAEEQRAAERDINKESRKPQSTLEVAKAENTAKAYQGAIDWLAPENLAAQAQTNREMKQSLSDIGSQLEAAHSGPAALDNPLVNKFRRETLGDTAASNVAANVKNLVATKIGQMKQAGIIAAGQLNSDKDIDLQFGAIFDVNAPLETQRKQLAKLQTSITEADKQIELKTRKAEALVSGKSQAEAIKPATKTEKSPLAGKILTKGGISYRVLDDGSVEQVQ